MVEAFGIECFGVPPGNKDGFEGIVLWVVTEATLLLQCPESV